MRPEARVTRRPARYQINQVQNNISGNDGEQRPPYKKKALSKNNGNKRKRKLNKPFTKPAIASPGSQLKPTPAPSSKPQRRASSKITDPTRQIIQANQISAAELTAHLQTICYLYETHPGAEFPHTIRDICEVEINHFNISDSDETESYTYRSPSPKSVEPSHIGSISDIPSTPDSCELFRLTTRTPKSSPEPQSCPQSKKQPGPAQLQASK